MRKTTSTIRCRSRPSVSPACSPGMRAPSPAACPPCEPPPRRHDADPEERSAQSAPPHEQPFPRHGVDAQRNVQQRPERDQLTLVEHFKAPPGVVALQPAAHRELPVAHLPAKLGVQLHTPVDEGCSNPAT